MRLSFPARYWQTHDSSLRAMGLKNAIKRAFHNLDWNYEIISKQRFKAVVSSNFWSLGEVIIVEITSENSFEIESRCVMETQCFDWGKNKSNVRKFLKQLAIFEEMPTAVENRSLDDNLSPVERVFAYHNRIDATK